MRRSIVVCAIPLLLAACALSPRRIGRQTTAGALQGTQQNPEKAEQAAERVGKGAAKGLAEGFLEQMGRPEMQAKLRQTVASAVAGAVDGALARPTGKGGGGAVVDPPARKAADPAAGNAADPTAREAADPPARKAADPPARDAADPAPRSAVAPSSGIGRVATVAGQGFSRGLAQSLGADGDGPLGRAMAGTMATVTKSAFDSAGAQLAPILAACEGRDTSTCVGQRIHDWSRAAGAGFAAGVRAELGWLPLVLAFLVGVAVAVVIALLIMGFRRVPRATTPRRAPLTPAPQH